jgi:sugar phosphate isomerase/epimerase
MLHIGLGVNSCFAVKRHAEPEEWLGILGTLGVRSAQVSVDMFDPFLTPAATLHRLVTRTRAAAEAAGVVLHSLFTGTGIQSNPLLFHEDDDARRRALEWHCRCVETAATLGCRAWGGVAGSMTIATASVPAARAAAEERAAALWCELAAHAGSAGLGYLLIEPMSVAREAPTGFEATDAFLARTRSAPVPTRLCVDVGHLPAGLSAAERDPYAWLTRYGSESPVIHLQQTDGARSHHWPFTAERNAVGIIDPARVLDALAASGAGEALLALEIFTPAFMPMDTCTVRDLTESVQYWRRWVTD